MKTIDVGGNAYKIEELNPLDAIGFSARVLEVAGPALAGGDIKGALASFSGAKAEALVKEALTRCFSPRNERLVPGVAFDDWFREHPADLLELGARAVWELVAPFLPNLLRTKAAGLISQASR